MGEGFLLHVSGSLDIPPGHENPAQQGGRGELTFHRIPEELSLMVSLHSTGQLATGAISQCQRDALRVRSSEPPEVTLLIRHLLATGLFLYLKKWKGST